MIKSYKTVREYVLQELYPEKLYLKQDINLCIQLDKNKREVFNDIVDFCLIE